MDSIYSAGVFLAMCQKRPFAAYEKRVRKGLMFDWRMVENYYTTPFMEIFLRPSEHANLFSAVIVAGEVEGRWALRRRRAYFFLHVKIQARWPFVPRIDFGAIPTMSTLQSTSPKAG